jgi:hypothetical protein
MLIVTDLKNKKTKVLENDFFQQYLKIGFTYDNKLPVLFDENFSFKIKIWNDELFYSFSDMQPLSNSIYISTDQEFIYAKGVSVLPNKKYSFFIEVTNGEDFFKNSFEILIAKPMQPYPSWIYDELGMFWEAPKQLPANIGPCFQWNEDLLDWEDIPCED